MSSLIAKQPKDARKQTTISLSTSVLNDLEAYCQFIDSARDWVINEALKSVFRRDKAFLEWRERSGSQVAQDGHESSSPSPAQTRFPSETETKIERPKVHRGPIPAASSAA
jgi:hypothetical protein